MSNIFSRLFASFKPNPAFQNPQENKNTNADAEAAGQNQSAPPIDVQVTDVQHMPGHPNVPVGIIVPTPDELEPRIGSDFSPRVLNFSGDWRAVITKPFFQQYSVNGDLNDCVPSSVLHTIDMQLTMWMQQPDFPKATRDWLSENGFLNPQGQAWMSELFLTRVDGTTPAGTSQTQVWNAIQAIGLIAGSLMPFIPEMPASQFYDQSSITPAIRALAAGFLDHFDFVTKTLKTDDGKSYDMAALQSALQYGPVNCFIGIGFDFNNPETQPMQKNANPCTHSIAGVFADPGFGLHILDQYPPFLKALAPDYYCFYIFQTLIIPRKVYNMAPNTATRGYQVAGQTLVYVAIESSNCLVPVADWQAFLNLGGTTGSIVTITAAELASMFNVIPADLFKSA